VAVVEAFALVLLREDGGDDGEGEADEGAEEGDCAEGEGVGYGCGIHCCGWWGMRWVWCSWR
jgi:hypothetical protein